MKKIVIMTVVLFALGSVSAFAASNDTGGFVAGPVTIGGGTVNGATSPTLTIQLSKNVKMEYKSQSGTGLGYLVATSHTSGTRTYASTSGDARIYFAEGTTNTAATSITPPEGTASVSWDSGTWTAM